MRRLTRLMPLLAVVLGSQGPALADPFDDAVAIATDPKALATRSAEAERLFKASMGSGERRADAAFNLGLVLLRRGDRTGAEAAWEQALGLDPNHLGAKARIAALGLDDPSTAPSALAALEALVREKCEADGPCDRFQPEARNALAGRALAEGRLDDAIRHGRNALLGDPENVNAFLNVAIAYFRKGLPDQAGLIATSALEKNPKAASLHNLMGLVYLAQDNSRAATQAFTAALEADPANDDARLNLAALELAYGDFASALKRFDEVLANRPNEPELVTSRAVALRGLKRFDEAEAAYRKAQTLPGANPDIGYNLCILHHQYTQRWADARSACDAYLAGLPDKHPNRPEVQKRLKGIEATLKALQNQPQTP
jgi:tetratricopeptide (TPR) repeat protein